MSSKISGSTSNLASPGSPDPSSLLEAVLANPSPDLNTVSQHHEEKLSSGSVLGKLHVRDIVALPDKKTREERLNALGHRVVQARERGGQRVGDLISLAFMCMEGLPEQVEMSAEEALDQACSYLSEAIGLGDDVLGTANYVAGKLLFEGVIGNPTGKKNILKKAEQHFVVATSKQHPGAIISLHFLRYLQKGLAKNVIKAKLLALADTSENKVLRVDMLYYIGKWMAKGLLPGRLKEAEYYLNESKDTLKASNYRSAKCRVLLGGICNVKKDYPKAIKLFLESVTLGAAGVRRLWVGLYTAVNASTVVVKFQGQTWSKKDLEDACSAFAFKTKIAEKPPKKGEIEIFDDYNQSVLSQVFKFKNRKKFEQHFYQGKYKITFGQKVGVAEGWTLREHVDRVLEQFDKHYACRPNLPVVASFYEGLFYLHDIGKPTAVNKGNKDRQHEFSRPIIQEYFKEENLEGVEVMLALIGEDPIGEYLNPSQRDTFDKPKLAAERLIELAKQARMPIMQFYEAILIYYKCDASCYKTSIGPVIFNYDLSKKGKDIVFLPHQEARMKKLKDELLPSG